MTQPLSSPLEDTARDTAGTLLQDTLVDLIDLSLVAKQAHWNLVGRHFHDIHLHLDELVQTARSYTDAVAERAATIGVSPDGRAGTVAKSSSLPEFPNGWVSDRDAVKKIFEATDTVVNRLRPRIAQAGAVDTLTEDLLISAGRDLEEARWMWQAQSVGFE
ncbi:MAG: DNA starvation/stationary phase protection protein [Pseudonocardia sp.]|nr:DNA starvation/stationary phase protection protein [Pseudonocardia sp.]MBO0873301.1 DNA starvation/stationary phase protection protein [Pseudonocardia sp.]